MVGKNHPRETTKFSVISFLFRADIFYIVEQKFITGKQIVKTASFYASTTVPTDFFNQIGVRSNVMDKTIRAAVQQICVYICII